MSRALLILAALARGAHSRYCKSAQIGGPDQATPRGESSDRLKSQPQTRLLPCSLINTGLSPSTMSARRGHCSPRRDQSAFRYGFSDHLQGIGEAQHATLREFALLGQLTQVLIYLLYVLGGVLNTVLGEVLG